jgi:hypothetical protein
LQERKLKIIFTEKFLLFQDKSSLVCQELYPRGIRLAYEMKVNTSELFYEVRLEEWHGKMDSKFPVLACILY